MRRCASFGFRQQRSGPGSGGAGTERGEDAQDTLRSGLWHPLNIPLPRAPSERELQHGFGPAGCAVLLQTRFDRRLDCCPSGDFGGEEGGEADRASTMLEPPLGATVFNVKR